MTEHSGQLDIAAGSILSRGRESSEDIWRADMIVTRTDDDILPVMDVLGWTSRRRPMAADQGERRRCRAPRNQELDTAEERYADAREGPPSLSE